MILFFSLPLLYFSFFFFVFFSSRFPPFISFHSFLLLRRRRCPGVSHTWSISVVKRGGGKQRLERRCSETKKRTSWWPRRNIANGGWKVARIDLARGPRLGRAGIFRARYFFTSAWREGWLAFSGVLLLACGFLMLMLLVLGGVTETRFGTGRWLGNSMVCWRVSLGCSCCLLFLMLILFVLGGVTTNRFSLLVELNWRLVLALVSSWGW